MRHRKLLVLAIIIMAFWFMSEFVSTLLFPAIGPFAFLFVALLLFFVGYLIY